MELFLSMANYKRVMHCVCFACIVGNELLKYCCEMWLDELQSQILIYWNDNILEESITNLTLNQKFGELFYPIFVISFCYFYVIDYKPHNEDKNPLLCTILLFVSWSLMIFWIIEWKILGFENVFRFVSIYCSLWLVVVSMIMYFIAHWNDCKINKLKFLNATNNTIDDKNDDIVSSNQRHYSNQRLSTIESNEVLEANNVAQTQNIDSNNAHAKQNVVDDSNGIQNTLKTSSSSESLTVTIARAESSTNEQTTQLIAKTVISETSTNDTGSLHPASIVTSDLNTADSILLKFGTTNVPDASETETSISSFIIALPEVGNCCDLRVAKLFLSFAMIIGYFFFLYAYCCVFVSFNLMQYDVFRRYEKIYFPTENHWYVTWIYKSISFHIQHIVVFIVQFGLLCSEIVKNNVKMNLEPTIGAKSILTALQSILDTKAQRIFILITILLYLTIPAAMVAISCYKQYIAFGMLLLLSIMLLIHLYMVLNQFQVEVAYAFYNGSTLDAVTNARKRTQKWVKNYYCRLTILWIITTFVTAFITCISENNSGSSIFFAIVTMHLIGAFASYRYTCFHTETIAKF